MDNKKKKYNLPAGYSIFQTAFKSNDFVSNPIKFISKSMEIFSGTYTATLGFNRKLILTQNPGFINYILKENHRNYNKSKLATERAVAFLAKGCFFQMAITGLGREGWYSQPFIGKNCKGYIPSSSIRSMNTYRYFLPAKTLTFILWPIRFLLTS